MAEPGHPQSDHDLLIRLDTKMDRSADDIKSLSHRVEEVRHDVGILSDSMEAKIAAAVSGKADTSTMLEWKREGERVHDAQQKEIDQLKADQVKTDRKVDKYIFIASGALAAVQFVFQFGPIVWNALQAGQ